MIKLFDYQNDSVEAILNKFKVKRKILYQLSTGGGKTFIFSDLTRRWIEAHRRERVLILCHKEELVTQTIASLNSIGITCEAITDKTKKLKHNAEVYVAMIETSNNRLKKDPYFFKDVSLVIADECHILIFQKVYDFFPSAKILGCSATPVLDKKQSYYKCNYCKSEESFPTMCCGQDMREWIKPKTLSQIYEDIVVGVSIKYLIDIGRLVPEITFTREVGDGSELSIGADGEFTSESMEKSYGNKTSVFNCLMNYEELAKGKKTMIFNGTTATNKKVYEEFKESGYNVRMYDSVHSKKSERRELVEWFENTPDAILCNVGCFTTGFDVTDVQCIMMNRPTNSLSLFLQIVGRGGRCTNKIYKPNFIFIDGGGNVERFNEWSDDTRDWEDIFFNGIGEPREKRPKGDITDVQNCDNCDALMPKNLLKCPECGHEMKAKPERQEVKSQEVLQPIREIPPPNAKKIHEYTLRMEKNCNFAFQILVGQIVDMFRFYRVTLGSYIKASNNGSLKKRIDKMINPVYFHLIAQDDIKAPNHRKLSYVYNKAIEALDKFYNIIKTE